MKPEKQRQINLLVNKYSLVPHPEGGYYKQTFKSKDNIVPPARFGENEELSAGTAIFFLLSGEDFSAWHKLNMAETWHYYGGGDLKLYIIEPNRKLTTVTLGNPLSDNTIPQYTIEPNKYFSAELSDKEDYCFVGCTVSPGFEFRHFELANRNAFSKQYPEHSDLIKRLTRVEPVLNANFNDGELEQIETYQSKPFSNSFNPLT